MRKLLLLVVLFLTFSIGLNPISTDAAIADGTHNINYQVNKPNSSSASMANDYFLKPAKLIVSNGSMKIQLTIKNSSWVTEFHPPGGATVVSSNPAADQRVVQFNVSNLNPLNVGMKIDIESLDYHHSYTVDFIFDSNGLPQKKEEPAQSSTPPSTNTGGNSNNGSSSSVGGTASSSEKPATSQKPSTQQGSSGTSSGATNSNKDTSSKDESSKDKVVTNEETKDVDEATNEAEPTEAEEQEENPETSDVFPLYAVVLMALATMLMAFRKKII